MHLNGSTRTRVKDFEAHNADILTTRVLERVDGLNKMQD